MESSNRDIEERKGKQMKRYSISYGREVNERYSKTGVRYHYWGRTDDAEKFIKEEHGKHKHGFQIRDSVTKEVIYKE